MPRLRVALLHYTAAPVLGGVERVVGEQARLLASVGHEVRIVAGRGGSEVGPARFVPLPLADPRDPRISAAQASLARGVVPPEFPELVGRLLDDLAIALEGMDLVLAHNVCSLHFNLALTAALRRFADETAATRVVAWHHDLAWLAPQHRGQLHDGAPWDLLRTAWPGVTTVVVSEQRRAEWSSLSGLSRSRIQVVPNGFEPYEQLALDGRTRGLLQRRGLTEADLVLLTPARITPRKNLTLGIRILAALRRRGVDAHLIVTGPPDPHDPRGAGHLRELRRLARELGVEDAAHFLGSPARSRPSDRVMRDLYRVADGLLLTSTDEGFGLPVLEAAAARLPIFCPDLPSLRELAGGDATYLPLDGDPAALARQILGRLRGDPAYRIMERLRRTHRWTTIGQTYLEPLLERVVSGRPA
jgi:glycosyltransferase involved in cell wall biosynthesis